jgi:serine acetyltransferase
VVNKSFMTPNITIGGVPAKKISGKESVGLIIPATEILEMLKQRGFEVK